MQKKKYHRCALWGSSQVLFLCQRTYIEATWANSSYMYVVCIRSLYATVMQLQPIARSFIFFSFLILILNYTLFFSSYFFKALLFIMLGLTVCIQHAWINSLVGFFFCFFILNSGPVYINVIIILWTFLICLLLSYFFQYFMGNIVEHLQFHMKVFFVWIINVDVFVLVI